MKKYLIVIILVILGGVGVVLMAGEDNQAENVFDIGALIAEFSDGETKKPESEKVKIILGGDVMLGRSVEITSRENGDFSYPFVGIADYLSTADVVFVNLENPIVENCPARNSGLIFCANPEMLSGLSYANINVVNLANNHTLNYGQVGLASTKKYLAQNKIGYTGDGELYVLLVNGVKFGFLGFNRAESNKLLTEPELNLVKNSDIQVDVLIVAMHWGNEYHAIANNAQRQIAKQLVENGADVVVGHHPHWVEDWETIGNAPVYYSLGNLVFDQMWSEETKKGMLVELTFEGNKIVEQKQVNTYIKQLGQPIIAE